MSEGQKERNPKNSEAAGKQGGKSTIMSMENMLYQESTSSAKTW